MICPREKTHVLHHQSCDKKWLPLSSPGIGIDLMDKDNKRLVLNKSP